MRIFKILIFLLSALTPLFSQALPPLRLMRTITIENGLPQSSISSIVQDKEGYLWLGTQKGVSRWNGKTLTNFSEENGLAKDNIRSLFCTSRGEVLIGTFAGVTSCYMNTLKPLVDPGKKLADKIYSIYETKNGRLCFGTDNNGVIIKEKNNFTYLTKKMGLVSNSIVAISEDDEGAVIFGSKNDGISVYKNGQITNYSKSNGLPSGRIISLLKDTDGAVIITSARGLSRYKNGVISNIYLDDKFDFTRGKNSAIAEDGTIYFITTSAIYQMVNGKAVKILSQEKPRPDFNCIYISENGTIFVGTQAEGLKVFTKPFIFTLNSNDGLIGENVFSISEDRAGSIYFAAIGGGIGVYSPKSGVKLLKKEDGLVSNSFYSVLTTHDNVTYFGSSGRGVSVLKEGKISTPPIFNELKNKRIQAMYQAFDSSLFFCTPLSIWRLKNNKLEDFGKEIGLSDKKVDAICNTRDGAYYLCVHNYGLVKYKSGEIKLYNNKNGLYDYDFYSISEGKNGAVYIGTDGGLFILKNNSFSHYNKNNGLTDNTIYSIVEDNSGKIYLGTTRGINILDFSGNELLIRYLGKEDGLASSEMNEKAAFYDSNGRLWFGTVKGVSCYYPMLDIKKTGKPGVKITGFIYSGEKRNTRGAENINISDAPYQLQINFEGIDIDSPEKTSFLYRLKGLSEGWERTSLSSINYSNLSSGGYTFEIMAVNSWGIKSSTAVMSFTIPTPLWRKWWMIVIYFVILAAFITYLFFQKRNKIVLTEENKVELANLSKRENEIIQLLLQGDSYKTISEKIFISPATVQSHIKNIYKKLNIHSKYELFKLYRSEEEGKENK